MGAKEALLSAFLVILFVSSAVFVFSDLDETKKASPNTIIDEIDPLFQGEGHNHSNASQHARLVLQTWNY